MDATQFQAFMNVQQKILEKMNSSVTSNNSTISVGANTALIPNFEALDTAKESFRNYKLRFENYTQMKGIHTNKQYCANLLLNSIGSKNFSIVTALAAPANPNSLEYEELMKLLQEHLSPQQNVLVAQHQFLSKYQEDLSIAEYVAKLRADIGDCEFYCKCKASVADIFLRAQFIRGIKDNFIREQLLQNKLCEFSEIVTKALALEAAKSDSNVLAHKTNQVASNVINRISGGKGKNNNQNRKSNKSYKKDKFNVDFKSLGLDGLCLRCGRNNHYAKDCLSDKHNLKCAECKKTGHVVKVCIKARMKAGKSSHESTNQIEGIRQYGVLNIADVNQSQSGDSDKIWITINFQGQPIKFEVDTGSKYTFLPRDQYAKLNLNAPFSPAKITFQSYTQNFFTTDGKVEVEGEYNGTSITDDIYIVPEEFNPILGRNWCRKLKLKINCDEINPISSINQVSDADTIKFLSDEFQDIFQPKIGCVQQYKISLKLRKDAKPIFNREREIPYALIGKVGQELDHLEKSGVISKTEISDWGSPLVVIPKSDGGVRLCVDYKVGVNERLVDAHGQIRKVQEIFNCLRNSKYFCRLDLYKAYLHIPVDEDSSKIQTMSTHRGTYKVNRLSFGIKTAPSEFNRILNQILQNVPKTEAYFDDIIVQSYHK